MRRADKVYLPLKPTAFHGKRHPGMQREHSDNTGTPSLLQINQFSGFYDTTHQTTVHGGSVKMVYF